ASGAKPSRSSARRFRLAELSLVGISHHGASLEVRERVALDPDEAADLARELAGDEGEAVCLSTCNRTELYVAGPGAEERAAGALAERVLGDLTDRQVLLIGAGEIGEATAGRLVARGARVAFVANRGEERRARVARRLEAEPLTLGEVASALAEADVVVASTNSRSFQVSHDDVER